jgi:hypothetical protein
MRLLMIQQGMSAAKAAQTALSGNAGDVITRLTLVQSDVRPATALSAAPDAVRGLSRAAEELDTLSCQELISSCLDHHGAVATWNHLLRPVLSHLGTIWQDSAQGIETEHLLSEVAATLLRAHAVDRLRSRSPRPVLMAAAPGELHTLPLVATAAAAAESQIECRLLGASIPYDSLASAIDRVGPAAVMLWSQSEQSGDPTRLASLPVPRPGYRILLGGPGWPEVLPARAERVGSVEEAVAAMGSAIS